MQSPKRTEMGPIRNAMGLKNMSRDLWGWDHMSHFIRNPMQIIKVHLHLEQPALQHMMISAFGIG